MPKNYLGWRYARTSQDHLIKMVTSTPHEVKRVHETTLGDDTYAQVSNDADVQLERLDQVHIDGFGRVNAFRRLNGLHYVLVES